MATITSTSLSPAEGGNGHSGALAGIKVFWREFVAKAFHPYRPELHYMRGPGPAWHAKYGSGASFRLKSDDI
jgi:hypothetical protein